MNEEAKNEEMISFNINIPKRVVEDMKKLLISGETIENFVIDGAYTRILENRIILTGGAILVMPFNGVEHLEESVEVANEKISRFKRYRMENQDMETMFDDYKNRLGEMVPKEVIRYIRKFNEYGLDKEEIDKKFKEDVETWQ